MKDLTKSKYDLEERTAKFAESIIDLCRSVEQSAVTKPLISQLVRSSSSIGANYAEANGASSKKDFRNKIYICKKEAQETKHWLRLLDHSITGKNDDFYELKEESQQLLLIFQKITSTLRAKENIK